MKRLVFLLSTILSTIGAGEILAQLNDTSTSTQPSDTKSLPTEPLPIVETLNNNQIIDLESLLGTSPRRNMDFVQTAASDGYPWVDTHFVITEDGYILRVFRLRSKKCEGNATEMDPLVFAYGLFLSADTCIIKGEGSHCYSYADACYDVWVLNVRGNRYSRNHTSLDPDIDLKFWDFDFDDMAQKDLAAVIDYVLKETCKSQITYLGHSQGMTMLLVLLALFPEYNDKIGTAFGFSTAAWLEDSRTILLDVEAMLASGIALADHIGLHGEIIKYRGVLSKTAYALCGTSRATYPVCLAFVFGFFGYNKDEITPNCLIDTVGHEPSGTSFGRWGDIRKFGFRMRRNGTKLGPEYPLFKVTAKIIFISCPNDYVSSLLDMRHLRSKLTNCPYKNCVLEDDLFGHLDFMLGTHAKQFCVDLVLTYLKYGRLVCKGEVIEAPH